MEEERTFQWGAIIVPAIVIFVLAYLVGNFLIGAIYPTIVGFQTRGDSEAIQKAIMELQTSPIMFVVAMILLPALVAFWRGRALAGKVEYRPDLHGAAAGALAAVIMFIINLLLSGFNFVSSLLPLVMWLIFAGGGGFLGARLAKKQAEG